MRFNNLAIAAILSCASIAPALAADAASEIRWADQAVAHQASVTREAIKGGDSASIAFERAKLQAAQAVAWGKRHPAGAPAKVVAAN
jgi:uncharacterized membrane-anchored protein